MSPELGVSSSSYDDYVFSPNLGLTLNEGGEFSVLWFELNNLGNRFFIRSYSRDNLPFKLEVNFQFKWGNSNPHPRLKLSKQADAIMVWQSGDISLDIFARRVKLNR